MPVTLFASGFLKAQVCLRCCSNIGAVECLSAGNVCVLSSSARNRWGAGEEKTLGNKFHEVRGTETLMQPMDNIGVCDGRIIELAGKPWQHSLELRPKASWVLPKQCSCRWLDWLALLFWQRCPAVPFGEIYSQLLASLPGPGHMG